MTPMRIAQPLDFDRLPRSDELICDDGEPMESARHRDQMNMLIGSLQYAWRDRTDFYVAGNMFLYFSPAQVKHNDFRGPDVFVVMNTTRRERKAWVTWEEGGRTPNVIIELLSESTERVDRGKKMALYAEVLKVPEYVLFDPFSGVLEGYDLEQKRDIYVRKPDRNGHVCCKELGLSLAKRHSTYNGIETDWLRWFGPDGTVLPLGEEDAAAERRRADDAESCGRELLLCLLPAKFGPLSEPMEQRIAQASAAELQRWSKRVPAATTLQDVFEDK